MGLFSFFKKKKDIPQEPAFVERRFLPRWKIVAPAKIKWPGSSDYLACEVMDLNLRGFALAMAEKIPSTNLNIQLYFNDIYFFDIEISITWHKEVEGKQIYGATFLKIRDLDKEKICQMMKNNFPSYLGKY